MFTAAEREQIRAGLIESAQADGRINAAATVGSGAADALDEWSDIDLALGLAPGCERGAVIEDWTAAMYGDHGAIHHVDVVAGAIYRVFLLASTLQVDLSFWNPGELAATSDRFRLLFGEVPSSAAGASGPDPAARVGLVWLYLLHVRSSIARGRAWQADYMLGCARTELLALACRGRGLPEREARGADRLPAALLARAGETLVGDLRTGTLRRGLSGVAELLLEEADHLDPELAARLRGPVHEIAAG